MPLLAIEPDLVAERDAPAIGHLQAREHREDRRLARARRAHDARDAVRARQLDVERELAERASAIVATSSATVRMHPARRRLAR